MKKKVYGKILALTLAASMVSVPVFAEESADGQQVEVSRQNEEENSEENAEKSTEEKKDETVEEKRRKLYKEEQPLQKEQEEANKVTVDDKEISNDVAPVIVNDRTLVPIRIVTETLGGEVGWNDAIKTVTLKIDGKEITTTIGKVLEAYGVAPQIINSRTYVPIRFVADELGSEVNWNEETKEITIVK